MRTDPEVADIFRVAGPAYRADNAGHLSLHQLKVMSAIEQCRTAALGGHVETCTDCGHWRVAYNSCRNRHCPRCQAPAARTWLAAREADLLPVGYFHVVFTLPAEVADIAFQNKALVYDLLFRVAAETITTIAADPKHLGARIGITAVLHTWGSAMTHHPHIHMVVPGGGIAPDGSRWISSRPAFLLPVRVLGKLFRRLFLGQLMALHDAGRLAFFGGMADLADRRAFLRHLSPVRKKRWVVYAKAPFAGPGAVLAYLSRYTHRVAISNSRILGFDRARVTFHYKDYRRTGSDRRQVMTLATDEFIRRFLLHVLPRGFHRIRHLRPARRLRPQGPSRTCPQVACRRAARRHRPDGSAGRRPPAMPILRRAHGRGRDLRALVPTTRPSACSHANRDRHAMIRHGRVLPGAEAHTLPARTTLAPGMSRPTPMVAPCSSLNQGPRPKSPSAVRFSPANAHPGRQSAHLAPGRNTKTP